jgi:hypothetical protein
MRATGHERGTALPDRKHLQAVTISTTTADDGAVLDESYPDKYLSCRSIGHQWKVIGLFHQGPDVVRALLCGRCDMDRHDYWTRGGERLGSRYHQPDGYRIGDGGASTWEVRREVLNRVTVYDSEDRMMAHLMSGRTKKKAAAG